MVGHDPQWWLENLVEREDRLRALSEASKKCSRLCEPRFTGERPLLRRPAALYADVSSSRCGAAWRNSGALALGSADRCLHLITRASTSTHVSKSSMGLTLRCLESWRATPITVPRRESSSRWR
jgi:hypothetical protein